MLGDRWLLWWLVLAGNTSCKRRFLVGLHQLGGDGVVRHASVEESGRYGLVH